MSIIRQKSGRESLEEYGSEEMETNTLTTQPAGTPLDTPLDTIVANAASTLFPNEDERIPLSPLPISTSTGITAEALVAPFKFLECDPLIPGEQPEPCPVCRENKYAYVPDYTILDDGDVFFDGKTCTQNLVLTVDSPAKEINPGPSLGTLENSAFIEEQKRIGIATLLKYFNKSNVATVYYYKKNDDKRVGSIVGAVIGGSLGLPTGPIGAALGSAFGSVLGEIPGEVKGYDLESEERDVIEELLPYTKYKFNIPIQRNARTRLLISIPVEFLDRVPTRLITEPVADFQTNLEVTINGDEFFPMIRKLRNTLRVYANRYDRWVTLDGGQIIEKRDFNSLPTEPYTTLETNENNKVFLNLRDEASNVIDFARKIAKMVKEGSGLSFDDPTTARGTFRSKLEKIKFKFDLLDNESLQIKQVIVNKPGCPEIIFSEDSQPEYGTGNVFNEYIKNNPSMQRSRTLFFIGALPDIDVDLNARRPKPWLDFVVTYTYPPVEVFYGSNPNTLLNDPNSLQCLAQAAAQSDIPGNPGETFISDVIQSALGIGLSLPDMVAREFGSRSCKTQEEIRDEYRRISSGDSGEYADEYKRILEYLKQQSKNSIAVEDAYLDILIDEIVQQTTVRKKKVNITADSIASVAKTNGETLTKKEIKQRAKDQVDNITIKTIWSGFINKIGACGFIDMTLSAIDCVAKGLGEESATKALTKAAFDAMEDVHLERIFVGLPPEKQEEIFGVVRDNFENMPAPWDVGYIAGQYSGPGLNTKEIALRREINKSINKSLRENRKQYEEDLRSEWERQFEAQGIDFEQIPNFSTYTDEQIFAALDLIGSQNATTTTPYDELPAEIKEIYELEARSSESDITGEQLYLQDEEADSAVISAFEQEISQVDVEAVIEDAARDTDAAPEEQPETNNSSTLNQNFDTRNFGNQSPGSGGTLGKALGNTQKEVFDAYRNAILDVVEADMLLEELNKLPGVPIALGIINKIKNSPCDLVDPITFKPRLDSFLNTLEADICDWDFELSLPVLDDGNFKENMLNLFRLASIAILEALKEAALALTIQIVKLIIDKILSIACDALATLGANLMDLIQGSDHFKKLLKDNLCPDTSEDNFYDALKNIMDATTDPDPNQRFSCLESLSNAELADFIDDISLMLTQGQVIQLLTASATEETIMMAIEVAATSDSECIKGIFSNPDNIIKFFAGLGYFIPNLDEMAEALVPDNFDRNIHPCPDDIADILDDLRCDLFQQKGLSLEECRDRIDDLKDKALQDLEDLVFILQNGPFNDFPPLVSDRGCPPNGFLPAVDPLISDLQGIVSQQMFQNIEKSHLQDLMSPINLFTGRGGVLNAILSDTRGRPWKFHNWLVGAFGSPLSEDLGIWEFYSDNSIRDPDRGRPASNIPLKDPPAVDIYGNILKKATGDFGISIGGVSYGGYPPTVGAWMARQLRDLDPKVKTLTVPEGFSSITESLDAWQAVYEENQSRIEKRLLYLEAFFNEFEFDTGGPLDVKWPQKYALAKAEMIRAAKEKIFDPNDLRKTFTNFRDDSGENRVWRVLNGKNISIGGQLIGTKKLTKWDDVNRETAGTEGKDFIDYWGQQSRLIPEPDISSADIILNFADFGDDPKNPGSRPMYQFNLNYDYNLFNDDGNLKQNNEYSVRLDITYESASGGERERKRKGIEIPSSILGESAYTYTKSEIITKGSLDLDVEEFINNLGIYNEIVKDSYQIETMYKFFVGTISDASDHPANVFEILSTSPEVRKYFAKSNRSTSAFDTISSGFLRRISKNISFGRLDLPLDDSAPVDSEPGFLDPPTLDDNKQTRKEERKQSKIALNVLGPGFRYGYDPYEAPQIEYLDPEKYGGLLTRNLIKIGADPESLPKPFYVKPQKFTGWMDLANRMVPEVSGCEPASKPLFKLDDISEMVSKLCSELIPDPRLQFDPLCAEESPYDKILEVGPSARIDGVIRAVIRIYLVDALIRGTSVFTTFGMTNENYDDLFPAYIANKIKEGLVEDGRLFSGRTSNTYYYRFLEQIYNTVRRKIDSKLIDQDNDLSEKEKEARFIIEQEIQQFYSENTRKMAALSSAAISSQNFMKRLFSTPATIGLGYGSSSFNKKKALIAKNAAFNEMMERTEEQALVFLERYIREEFESIKNVYQSTMPSSVNNIDYLFLLSDTWIKGGVFGSGPFNVQSNPRDGNDFQITTGIPSSIRDRIKELEALPEIIGNPLIDVLRTSFQESNENWPFVLEKYIRIEEKAEPPSEISDRPENLYNIVNIQDWNQFIISKKDQGLSGDISNFWGKPPLSGGTTKIENHSHTFEIDEEGNGITSTHIDVSGYEHYHDIVAGVVQRAELNMQDNGHRHDIELAGWKYGLRLSYLIEKDKNNIFKEAMEKINDNTAMQEKSYRLMGPDGVERYIIPIASAELPIPDQEFSQFDPETYDVYCLIKELVKTVEYKTWFKYMFPLTRFTSLIAIYVIEGFFASLGVPGWPSNGGDMWEVAGGRKSIGPTFRKWARSDADVFRNSREDARDAFNTLYDTAASIDFNSENKHNYRNQADNLRDRLRPKTNFEDGLRWWQRGRRLNRNPFDQDGDECPDE